MGQAEIDNIEAGKPGGSFFHEEPLRAS